MATEGVWSHIHEHQAELEQRRELFKRAREGDEAARAHLYAEYRVRVRKAEDLERP